MEIGGDEPNAGASPWAPGGAMSSPDTAAPSPDRRSAERQATPSPEHLETGVVGPVIDQPGDEPANAMTVRTDTTAERSLPRWLIPAVTIVAVALGTVIVATATGGDEQQTAPTTTETPAPTTTTAEAAALTPLADARTSIGDVRWNRVVDDAADLPRSVVASVDSEFIGRGDDGSLSWVSTTGIEWAPLDTALPTVVAGRTWSIGSEGTGSDRLALSIIDGGDRTAVAVTHSPAARAGIERSWAAPVDGAGPYAIDEQVFVQLDRLEAVPWEAAALEVPDDGSPFMVRVSVEGGSYLSFQSAIGNTDAATDVWAVRRGDRVDLETESGMVVWTVDADPTMRSPLDAVRPLEVPEWLRWDGSGFTSIERPWQSWQRVRVVQVADRLVAIAMVSRGEGARAWTSTDGVEWGELTLPVAPALNTPIEVHGTADELIVRISDGERTTDWTSTDGELFAELPAVPGINRRTRGDFGWVAPDPGGEPLIRVSADGEQWSEIDLGDELGFENARWDGNVEVTALDSSIFVVATVDDQRTLLHGRVESAVAPG